MKNTLILIASKFFEKGIMFFFFMLLAQKFGKESFGQFSYYFAIASIVFVLFNLGGEFYQIREFTKKESLKVFQNIFIFKTLIATLVIIGALVSQKSTYVVILVISFYLESIISIFRSSLYKNGLYYHESILIIIEKSAFILLVIFNVFTLNDLVLMYSAFIVAKLVYLVVAIKKHYKFKYLASSLRLFDLKFLQRYVFNSWSYMLHALLVIIFVQIDIIMLKWMGVPFKEIGLYSAAIKIYMTLVVFADILFKQYYPKISHLIHTNDMTRLRTLTLKIQSMNIYLSLFFSIMTMLFAHEIIAFSFGSEFFGASNMLVLLSIIIVFRFSMYTYTALLSASSFNSIKVITSLTCVFINIGLNYVLIPEYSAYGALVATIVTEFVLVLMYKISSLKIIFTNFITIKEIFSVSTVLLSAYFLFFYKIEMGLKLLVAALALMIFVDNIKQIRTTLAFEGLK